MAKQKFDKDRVMDRSLFYSDLAFMPPEIKLSNTWAAQMLFYIKRNSVRFLDEKKASTYRNNSNLMLDSTIYKNLIDPITPMGGGGTASYFASDWKALPIATHIERIIESKLHKIGLINKLQVNEINKFSKSQRQRDKDKIIHQENFRNIISLIAAEIGLPPMSKSQTAEEYLSKLDSSVESKGAVDDVSRLVEQIKSKIKDDKDYQLYEQYVYKGQIERAFELACQHYLIDENKWKTVSTRFNDDVVKFGKMCGRWYIDDTNGRGVVQYLDPVRVFTSNFSSPDGDDLLYWNYEYLISFADFIRMFGQTLTDNQLKEVFLLNKVQGAGHNYSWPDTGALDPMIATNAMILIGFAEVLTQDTETFSEDFVANPNPGLSDTPKGWNVDKESDTIKNKIYNCWYSFYYVPPPSSRLVSGSYADWSWQSKYVFKIQKVTDMFRYGVDRRYAKPSLVIYNTRKPSVLDIMEGIMPKIHTLWHKFQNAIVNDASGVAIDEDFFMAVLNAVDETDSKMPGTHQNPQTSNGVNAGLEAFRQLKQGGMAMLKFRDSAGNVIPNMTPKDFFVEFDNKMLDKAEKYLGLILQQYELLKLSLAQSDVTEGQTGKPRTTVAAIEAALESSNNAQWFIEYPVREFLVMYGERVVQHVINLVKDKKVYNYEKRWKDFEEVVGNANALMVEGIVDLEPEEIGLTVSLEDTTQLQDWIFMLANEMVKNNQLSYEAVGLIVDQARFNWKYAYALLVLSAKEKAEELAAQQELQYQQQMALKEKDLQIAQALQAQKVQGEQALVQTEGQIQDMINARLNEMKYQSQSALKDQTTRNRILETEEKEKAKVNAQMQTPTI